jgi:uncharacterized spore protein YtfJ
MKIEEMVTTTRDTLTVRRVYGEPLVRDGVTVIPAASVSGGGGGGGGHDPDGAEGEGGGFAMSAKPAGVYVVEGGHVRWRPAVDVNRLVSAGVALLIVGMVTRVRMERLRGKHRRG